MRITVHHVDCAPIFLPPLLWFSFKAPYHSHRVVFAIALICTFLFALYAQFTWDRMTEDTERERYAEEIQRDRERYGW